MPSVDPPFSPQPEGVCARARVVVVVWGTVGTICVPRAPRSWSSSKALE